MRRVQRVPEVLRRGPASLVAVALVLGVAAVLLAAAAFLRSAEYDEGYSLLLTAGTVRPDWPTVPFLAGEARAIYAGSTSLPGILSALRGTDVHPPLYFWLLSLWRDLVGMELFAARLLSVVLTLAALALVAPLAVRAGAPPVAAMLVCLLSYAFAYTGIIARGFALAQVLTLAAALLALAQTRGADGARATPGLAGAVLVGAFAGLATMANYLALFCAAAVLAWHALFVGLRRPWHLVASALPFLAAQAVNLPLFLAQDRRTGQFPPFSIEGAAMRSAQWLAASVFGGTPLQVDAPFSWAIGAAIGLLLLLLAVAILATLGAALAWPEGLLVWGAGVAPAIGLVALGALFGNLPLELRYYAFGSPFIAILIAGSLAAVAERGFPTAARALLAAMLLAQAAGIAGLGFGQGTMQPARAVARNAAPLLGEGTIIAVAHGNDGVGIAGALILELPAEARVLVIRRGDSADSIRSRLAPFVRAIIVTTEGDSDSREEVPLMLGAVAGDPAWRLAGEGYRQRVFSR
ncbi:glycosyltransferase family 39 protein [Elioraea sp.]|uniref:glycosyltransferase family 39 protein n=1 Tax=Elioraea sp. TaxID=2185103 RepID=UPI0025B9E848|nr:glycosyltransferase family 39 protein [Elioraea sp.]